VVLLEFAIEIADVVSWMKICMPYGILETIKGYLISTPSREDMEMRAKWFQKLQGSVNEVPLELRAVLGKKKLTVQEFLKMKRDSVIITDSSVDEPIDLTIMDITKLRGRMGIWRGNKAVKIEQILN
jgi:flagellar motor switch protein FliM